MLVLDLGVGLGLESQVLVNLTANDSLRRRIIIKNDYFLV